MKPPLCVVDCWPSACLTRRPKSFFAVNFVGKDTKSRGGGGGGGLIKRYMTEATIRTPHLTQSFYVPYLVAQTKACWFLAPDTYFTLLVKHFDLGYAIFCLSIYPCCWFAISFYVFYFQVEEKPTIFLCHLCSATYVHHQSLTEHLRQKHQVQRIIFVFSYSQHSTYAQSPAQPGEGGLEGPVPRFL